MQNLQIIHRLIALQRQRKRVGASQKPDTEFMESLNCPKNRRLARNKINQYQLYELHNLLKLLFVIVRERDPGIVQQDDEGEVSGLYVCVLVYICECVRRAQTASELWSLQPMM